MGEEVGQSSGGTAQKKSQANQASVALALEVGGCFPLSVPGGLPALLFFFVRTFVRIVRPCMRESRCVCSYVWLFVFGGVFFFQLSSTIRSTLSLTRSWFSPAKHELDVFHGSSSPMPPVNTRRAPSRHRRHARAYGHTTVGTHGNEYAFLPPLLNPRPPSFHPWRLLLPSLFCAASLVPA